MEPDRLKIVVFGAFGAGKTTLIKTLDPVSRHIEAPCPGGTTTVALDFGKLEIDGRHVYLFGTPGQERFEFAREIIGRGMDGAILLVDATSPFDDFVAHLHESLAAAEIPFRVFLNKCDTIGSKADTLRQVFRQSTVIQVSAKEQASSLSAIRSFVATLPRGRHGHHAPAPDALPS